MKKIEIIFEDKDILIINKPESIHSDKGKQKNIIPIICSISKELSSLEKKFQSPVHRLDYKTSGILVFAKKRSEWIRLRKLFSLNIIEKTYEAILENNLNKKIDKIPFNINLPLSSRYRRSKKVQVNKRLNKSLFIETKVVSLKKIQDSILKAKIKIKTGKRHQIRAHLSHIGLPILGDNLYGSKSKVKRMYLHASMISIPLLNGKLKKVSCSPKWNKNLQFLL